MNHLFVPHASNSSAATPFDTWVYQSHDTIYMDNGGLGSSVVAAAAAAEAAATAAVAAIAAANAAQEAASAANAATAISHNYGKQGHRPFPARRCKLRPDDSWRKLSHQGGWRSSPRDGNRARSHKRQSNGYGAERGSLSKSRRLSKQRPQHTSQPQQQWKVRCGSYKQGDAAAEANGHCGKAKDGQPRSTWYAGGKASPARHFPGKNNQDAVPKVLKFHEQAGNMSTSTPPDKEKGSQTEPFQDKVPIELPHESHQYFSLNACDSDDDEAEFFPTADPARSPHKEDTE